jgi:glycosyltransferase involved in cell wall biosynthesis
MADLDPVAAIFHGVRTWPTMRQFQRLRPEVPRVLMVHTAPRLLDRWRWRKVAAATMRSAHAVVAVSHVQQRWLETTAPMDRHAGKLTCIPSGVDVDFWRHEPALIPRDRPRLAMVGSLVAEKGQDALIRAVGLLRGAGRSVELTLVGDGPSRVDLERLAGKLGIARRVRFSGQADPETVRDILHETDIYVHASPAEGRSIAVMEALCAGRAVVAVDSPGMAELVTPGKTGWLIPSASPQPIADVVAGVLDRPDDALRVAREGFREATEHFNRTRMAERFESLLGLLTGETG